MKQTTYINNAKMMEWGLNYTQAAVVDWLTMVPGWAEQIIIGNEVWYFAAKSLCLKELPNVGSSFYTIYLIYKSLEKKGLIRLKKIDGKDYVILEKKIKEWQEMDRF